MKLNALILTVLIAFSNATTAQAETLVVNASLRNILHHKVRSHRRHQNNHSQHQRYNSRRNHGRNRHHIYRGDRRSPQPYRTYRRRHNSHNQHHGDRRVNYRY